MDSLLAQEPAVIVASITAAGAIVGALLAKLMMGRKDSAEMALQIAKEARADVAELRAEVGKLRSELGVERSAHSETSKRYRLLAEKYSVALAYILSLLTGWAGLKVRLKVEGFAHGEPPPLPDIIAEDVQKPPCLDHDE